MRALRPIQSYDAVDLTTVVGSVRRLTFWLESGLDGGLDVRGVDKVIPRRAGRLARDRVADLRTPVIKGWVRGVGADDDERGEDFRDAMNDLLGALFLPTRAFADLVVGPLEDGVRTATIAARPLPGPIVEYKPVPAATVTVRFEAVSPFWTFDGP